MAVRRRVLEAGQKFNETIGPNWSDKNYAMGSETEFCVRASETGHKAWFASKPTIQHIVRAQQLTWPSWTARAYRLGRGAAQLNWESGALIPKVRRSRFQYAVGNLSRYWSRALLLLKACRLDPRRRFDAVWEYNWYRGFQDEYVRRRTALFAGAPIDTQSKISDQLQTDGRHISTPDPT